MSEHPRVAKKRFEKCFVNSAKNRLERTGAEVPWRTRLHNMELPISSRGRFWRSSLRSRERSNIDQFARIILKRNAMGPKTKNLARRRMDTIISLSRWNCLSLFQVSTDCSRRVWCSRKRRLSRTTMRFSGASPWASGDDGRFLGRHVLFAEPSEQVGNGG